MSRLGLFEQYRPDAVIHAAAINPGVDDDNLGTNETMSARVAEAARATGSRLVDEAELASRLRRQHAVPSAH